MNATIVTVNPAACALFGVRAEDLIARSGFDFLPAETRASAIADLAAFARDGVERETEYMILRPNGEPRRVEARVALWRDATDVARGFVVVIRDKTRRQRAEAELRRERDQSQTYLDLADVAFIALDHTGKITLINQKGCAMLGDTHAEIIGCDWFAVCLPDRVRAQVCDVFNQLMTGDIAPVEFYENPVITKDGTERIIAFHNTVTHDAQGTIIGILSSGEDITEHRQAEIALSISETRFRTSVETMLDAFGIYTAIRDSAGRIVDFRVEYVNATACTSNQMTKEEQIGKHLCEILPAHRSTGLFEEYCCVVETGIALDKETFAHEDVYGMQHLARAFDIHAVKLGDGFAAAWRDVTNSKRAQAELVRQNKELATLNAIISAMTESLELNRTLQATLDRLVDAVECASGAIYLMDEKTGALTRAAQHGIDPADPTLAAQLLASGNPVWIDKRADSSPNFSTFISLEAKEKAVGVMILTSTRLLDEREMQFLMTTEQQIGIAVENVALAEQTREIQILREMDRLRSELVANVSYELRTLLGLITLFTTALIRQHPHQNADERLEFINDINEETDKLTHIVDNLLDLSRLQSGRLRLDQQAIAVGALAQAITAELCAHASRHEFTCDISEALIAFIDARQIEQVFRNLLHNAVKYSPNGGAIVTHAIKNYDQVIVQISDHGIGISASAHKKIFERFYRVPGRMMEQIDGVGLGLAVCQGIVQAHGGEIWVESVEGAGSTFYFTLPGTDPKGFPKPLGS